MQTLAWICTTLVAASALAASGKEPSNHKAEALAAQAAVVAKGGQIALAGQMFHAAFKLNASAWEYLYSAARAEQLAGDIPGARRDYARYLGGAPQDHALRPRAEKYAAEVEEAHEAAEREARARRRVEMARERELAETGGADYRRTGGWATVAIGALSTGVGLWMYGGARGRKSDLEARASPAADGVIRAISYREAQAEADVIRGDLRLGGAVLGAGAAIAALGGWLVWSAKDDAAPVPAVGVGRGGSMTFAWSF